MRHALLAAVACLFAISYAGAQLPASSLKGAAATPAAPATAFKPNVPAHALEVPANLAKLDDNAIIIIGGKPTTAGEAKRIVRSLDDNAIIIIGGTPTAAADVKRQLDAARAQQKVDSPVARPSTLSPWPAPAAGTKALAAPAGRINFGIHEIDPGFIYPNQKFVIRGIGLGDKSGEVQMRFDGGFGPIPLTRGVTTTRWSSTRIDAEAPSDFPILEGDPLGLGAGVIVTTATGEIYVSGVSVRPR